MDRTGQSRASASLCTFLQSGTRLPPYLIHTPHGAFQSFTLINRRCWMRPRQKCLPCVASVTICIAQQDRPPDFQPGSSREPGILANDFRPHERAGACKAPLRQHLHGIKGRMQRQWDATSLIPHVWPRPLVPAPAPRVFSRPDQTSRAPQLSPPEATWFAPADFDLARACSPRPWRRTLPEGPTEVAVGQ
jgi:hypothetical protein